jgi:hypothetical protein
MDSIDRFNAVVGKIFAELYETFPVPMDLSVEMLFDELVPGKPGTDSYKDYADSRGEFFSATVGWLVHAGYLYSTVRNQHLDDESFMQACLTAKAVECLKGLPPSLGGKTLGKGLSEAIKNSASDSLRSLASEALTKGTTYAYSAASSFFTGS